jgi:hypothetical protein
MKRTAGSKGVNASTEAKDNTGLGFFQYTSGTGSRPACRDFPQPESPTVAYRPMRSLTTTALNE